MSLLFVLTVYIDDDAYLAHPTSQHLGEISLAIWRIAVGLRSDATFIPIPEDPKIHERSKKALDHRVKCGWHTMSFVFMSANF